MPTPQPAASSPDTAEITAAFERLRATLLAWFQRRGAGSDAEDLVQEVWVRLHHSKGSVAARGALTGYLFRVARNLWTDRARRRRIEPVPDAGVEPTAPSASRDMHREAASWLPGFIHTLPPRYRDTLTLSELEALPHREIAARLGVTVSAVKSRVQRGRVLLRQALLQCCALELDARGKVIDWHRRHSPCAQPPCDATGCDQPTTR